MLGALFEDLGAGLAVVGVVARTFFGALFADTGTGLGQLGAVVGATGHEPGVERGNVGDIPTKSGTLLHLLVAETLISTPLTHLGGLVANLDTLLFLVTQMVNCGDRLYWLPSLFLRPHYIHE